MTRSDDTGPGLGRRTFFAQLSALAVTSGAALAGEENASATAGRGQRLPTVPVGSQRVSRLIAGWNPIGGHSYLGPHMDQHMKDYFTVDRTAQFLVDCTRAGINTHQFSPSEKTPEVLRKVRETGAQMNFFGLHSGREGVPRLIKETQPFALSHHGGVTDRLFREQRSQDVHDYVKAVHDHGLLAGVSAHNPDCIRRMADEDWEVDFFMCCFYFLTRPIGAAKGGRAEPETLQIAYPFFRNDPTVMTSVIQQVQKPCFGFKILAAGRKCSSQATVREAFRFAFGHIKPSDCVIVGMYPRFFDEVNANASYTRNLAAKA